MKKMNSGFTLIELVVVIVILGILAVSAVPRFIDLSTQAEDAVTDGIAGALASGMAVNYAGCAASDFVAGTNCVAVTNACTLAEAGSILNDAGALTGYTIGGTANVAAGTGGIAACTVTHSNGTSVGNYTSIDTVP